MQIARLGRSCAILGLALAIARSVSGQEARISGKVVDKHNAGIGNARIWVMRGAETVTTTTSSDTEENRGSYSISYGRGAPVDVLYDCTDPCAGHASTSVFGISGQSNHEITKVLPVVPQHAAFSPAEASEVLMTLEYLERHSSVFYVQLSDQSETLKQEAFPDGFRATYRQLQSRFETLPMPENMMAIGTWDVTIKLPQGGLSAKLVIEKESNKLVGRMESEFFGGKLDSVEQRADRITFRITSNAKGRPKVITYAGKVGKRSMKGNVELEGSGAFAAWSAIPHQSSLPANIVTSRVDITGRWSLMVERLPTIGSVAATFEQDGEKLSGTYEYDPGTVPLSGTVRGADVEFTVKLILQGQEIRLVYTGKVDGNSLTGSVRFMELGSKRLVEAKWIGKRFQ